MANGTLWTPADEIRFLQCLAAHAEAHGEPPERCQLLDAVAGRGPNRFDLTQLYEKKRRLKNRYSEMRHAGGVASARGDAHKARVYELSTAIWGDLEPKVAAKKEAASARRSAKKEDAAARKKGRRGFEDMQLLYPSLVVAVESIIGDRPIVGAALERAFQLMDHHKAAELDAKVKKYMVREAKMNMKRDTVKNEVLTTLIQPMDMD